MFQWTVNLKLVTEADLTIVPFWNIGCLYMCSKCFSNGQYCINIYLYQIASLSYSKNLILVVCNWEGYCRMFVSEMAVLWLSWLVADVPMWRSRSNHNRVSVGCIVDEWHWYRFHSMYFSCFLPLSFCWYSLIILFIYNWCYIIILVNEITIK